MERTFIMLKPDCIKRGLIGKVISRIEENNYLISDAKMMKLTSDFLREHYSHIKDEPFFPRIENYMLSGAVLGMIVEGENIVENMRKLIGATKIENALPGTIRGDFGLKSSENIIHGSDSVENAIIEINRFFG